MNYAKRQWVNCFGVVKSTISEHLANIYKSRELEKEATVRKIRTVQNEAGREVNRNLESYNLDAIISVGYRVNSHQATQFRIWATKTLKEFIIKGFVLDDERLKQGKKLFGKDYFDELLERVREIRASERRFYQKITDIYSECSIDYQPKAELPNMGLTTWKNSPKGKVLKSDVSIAKNYLNKKEIDELNQIVTMYLDFAEKQASRQIPMNMKDWAERLDAFLQF